MQFPSGIAGEVTGSGPDLVWGHGLSGSARAGDDELDLIGVGDLAGGRVTRYDVPGHGESAPVGDDEATSWPKLGTLMLEVATSVGARRFVAAGASMGAATALWAAVNDPARIAAMILAIPPTAWETRAEQADLYQQGAELAEQQGIGAYLQAGDLRPLNPSLEELAPVQRAAQRNRIERADPVSFVHVLRGAARSNLPDRGAIAELEMPALICSWENDPAHPLTTGEELAILMPNARLVSASNLPEIRGWPAAAADFLGSL